MKQFILAIFVLSNLSVFGQNPDANTEVYVTYGSNFLPFSTNGNNDQINAENEPPSSNWPINFNAPDDLREIGNPALSRGGLSSTGILTVGYNIRKGNHVVGGMFNYEGQVYTQRNIVVEADAIISESKAKIFSLAARYHYNWINDTKLKLYSGISAGGGIRQYKTDNFFFDPNGTISAVALDDFLTEKTTDFVYHFHANAIGIRYGTDWGLILELGIGHRGYVNVGINHHLFASDKWIKEK